MKTATITLAGREYAIEERKAQDNAAWRAALAEPFGPLAQSLNISAETQISPQLIAQLINSGKTLLLDSITTVTNLVIDYGATTRADGERIRAEAYDSEILEAFGEVTKLAFPFGPLLTGLLRLVQTGRLPTPISPSSPLPSGGAGMTNSMT